MHHPFFTARQLAAVAFLLLATYYTLSSLSSSSAPSAAAPNKSPSDARDRSAATALKSSCIHIEGLTGCMYYQRAVKNAERLVATHPSEFAFKARSYPRPQWDARKVDLARIIPKAQSHRTSPFVSHGARCPDDDAAAESILKEHTFIGGNDMFEEWISKLEIKS